MRQLMLVLSLLFPWSALAADPTLTIALRDDPDILDPTIGSAFVSRVVYASMCDKLFDLDEHLAVVPQLATGWTYEDPTHLLIKLRDGVTFHDGERFDAEAVKYSLTRHLTMKGSKRAGEIKAISEIQVVDPLTVRLVLHAPNAPLLAQLTDRSGMMLAPRAAEAAGDQFGLHPVCAGPYSFVERVAQDHMTLERFPQYWNAQAYHFDRVVFRPIVSSSVRLANLQAGALDLVEYIVPTDMDTVRKDTRLKLYVGDGLAYTGINFNVANGPAAQASIGQSALVRQAFELAIDRAAINQVVFNGAFTPTAQANPPSSPFYVPEVQPPARDVDRARALLKQAGVAVPVQVELTVTNGPDSQQTDEVIQAMAAEAGFDVKVRVTEFASALEAGYRGDFQAFLIGWSGRSDPDGNMWQLLHTGGTFNYGHWSNAAFDKSLDDAQTVSDVAARRTLYAKAWAAERADMPLVYLYTGRNIVGMRKDLVGFVQIPDGLIRLGNVQLVKE